MTRLRSPLSLPALLLALILLPRPVAAAEPAGFPLKNGDVWVMAGDSITAQHMHSNYFEAFCFARYPELKFAFRNSGVGGHTIPTTLARFDYDIAAWKPTIVSVELGMNDQGSIPTDKFLENMKVMVERIRGLKAQPIVLSSSPVNNGETMQAKGGINAKLDDYNTRLKPFCEQEKILYADQFHALLDIWGQNKPRELLGGALGPIKQLAQLNSLEGVEHLRAFIALQEKDTRPIVSMQGDPVHPGPPGQLMMAAALLKELKANGFVSSATLDATGKLVEAKGCQIEGITAKDGGLSFVRLDERLPFPIPEGTSDVLPLYPAILELSQYTLSVKGLAEGNYALNIGGVASGVFSAKQLDAGINLTVLPRSGKTNPIETQTNILLNAVAAKEALVSQWRNQSRVAHAAGAAPELKSQLATLTAQVEQADEAIRAAAKPAQLPFELVRKQ